MKKYLFFCGVLIFLIGCNQPAQDKKIFARINNYGISVDEFEEEFKASVYSRNDTLNSRLEFLSHLINRKLILQDAQRKNLDKGPGFLKMIERFWEQSLLKLALEEKSQEIAGSILVTEESIEEAYQKILKEGKTDKPYDQMYSQIKWEITKEKEAQAMNEWLEALHKKSNVKINYELIKPKK